MVRLQVYVWMRQGTKEVLCGKEADAESSPRGLGVGLGYQK